MGNSHEGKLVAQGGAANALETGECGGSGGLQVTQHSRAR